MVRVLLVSVMVASVLWHTLAGCCAHHAHDQAATASLHVLPTDCGCSAGHAVTPEPACDETAADGHTKCPGPDHAECHEAGCYFTLPRSADERLALGNSAAVAQGAAISYRVCPRLPAVAGELTHLRLLPPGSARRHLVLCVQLI